MDEEQNVVFSREGRNQDKMNEPENWSQFRGSSTGTVIFNTDFLRDYDWKAGDGRLSVYKDIIPELIKKGQLKAYNNKKNLFTDTGTPEKYKRIKKHEEKLFGALGSRYLDKKQ